MGKKYSNARNLAPGGQILSIDSLTGRFKEKSKGRYLALAFLVLILLGVGGLLIADYKGAVNLGLFPKKNNEE